MARIDDFKKRLEGGGTRPNQFRVTINFPAFVRNRNDASSDGQLLVKSASLPSSNIIDIPTPFRGRTTHFAGEREFQPWVISCYNATNFNIRNAFESWSAEIQNHASTTGRTNPNEYTQSVRIDQLDRNDAVLKTYILHNAYPSDLGAMPNDYDAQNQLQIFDVQFQYDYWTTDTTNAIESANGSNNLFGINLNVTTPVGVVSLF
ncbi:MAG: hypothetical protein HAW67_06770 [Endozoicomonadaceae bacterium]|nr:hypothetical protein [Endozoicomonadaceae bacterium]